MVSREGTKDNGHKLKYREFHLNTRKVLFFYIRVVKQWNRLPRAVVESPSTEVLKTQRDTVLDSLL